MNTLSLSRLKTRSSFSTKSSSRMELTPLESRLVPSTWWVTNNLDSGYGPDVPGSLRWDNDHAQNGDIIRFAQNVRGDSIQLTGPNLTIAHNIAIYGFSNGALTILGRSGLSEGFNTNIFVVNSGCTATISGFTLSNSQAEGTWGGAVSNFGNLTMTQCVISNNISDNYTGGIYNAGTLLLDQVNFNNNQVLGVEIKGLDPYYKQSQGGAIDAAPGSNTDILNCTFTGNVSNAGGYGGGFAYGGALYTAGNTNISNCTFTSNSTTAGGELQVGGTEAFARGGAIYAAGGRLSIWASTFVSNSAYIAAYPGQEGSSSAQGGALWQSGTTITTVVNSTFSANSVTAATPDAADSTGYLAGGTMYNGGGLLSIQQSTVVGGTVYMIDPDPSTPFPYYSVRASGGNIYTDPTGWSAGTTVTALLDTIVAEGREDYISDGKNFAVVPSDIQGYVESLGYNLIQSTAGVTAFANNVTGNIYGVDPDLGPLQNNGGNTETFALLSNSPALHAGIYLSRVDQRGEPRYLNDTDMGAFQTPEPRCG
ncbi:hypothetical protein KIH39_14465 [Telmatocola sphagniphila]|uniref:Right handed beta helix domain-containing protein n=1 Tax=Telmatocola sphagniphila TaxID=1123043 RepID=A0A8E6B2H8_9BACT|nr:choice-of-anchor Q domain-containing protein [Telmatocola sphagniphila]QVL30062.1 hypothetical protein KIH39_14465 [Telmatocola sphagniphila]